MSEILRQAIKLTSGELPFILNDWQKAAHLHHEFSTPLVIFVIYIIEGLDHLVQATRKVLAVIELEEGATELPVEHWSIVHQKVVPRVEEGAMVGQTWTYKRCLETIKNQIHDIPSLEMTSIVI